MRNLEKYIQNTTPVLVEFYTTWSESASQMNAVLDEVKQKIGDKATIMKVDTEEFSQWIEEYSVYKIPTLILFKEGKVL